MTPLVWNENRGAEPAGRLLVLAGDAAPRRKHVSHRAGRGTQRPREGGGSEAAGPCREAGFCNNASLAAIARQNYLPSVVASSTEARRLHAAPLAQEPGGRPHQNKKNPVFPSQNGGVLQNKHCCHDAVNRLCCPGVC